MTEKDAFAALASIPGLGPSKIKQLFHHFGSAQDALYASSQKIMMLPGFERLAKNWDRWKKDDAWQNDLDLAEQQGVQLVPFTDPKFPQTLLEVNDHPALLYIKGELKPRDRRSIAIVGTRQASDYGIAMAASIAQEMAANGFTIISGLARGIDTSAHRGALHSGRTAAVIGSGLSHIYPAENESLAQAIAKKGALISEYPMATPPDKPHFPQRNRIVSGMALATLLIEAPQKSGAMLTMDRAYQQKKRLFALPGRVDNENFRGNHLLIKSGKAHLVESAEDILDHFYSLIP